MTKRLLLFSLPFLFIACKKDQVQVKDTPVSFTTWLMQNARYNIAESSTGTIIFNASEIKLDGQIVKQRGIFYFMQNPQPEMLFPTIKEINAAGYTRDIQIGSDISFCPNYRTQKGNINLKVVAGKNIYTWQDCPMALLEHESLPALNWTVKTPHTIEVTLNSPEGK